jgi:uncharacterized membrane protein YdbT with pleckstrin-like domain
LEQFFKNSPSLILLSVLSLPVVIINSENQAQASEKIAAVALHIVLAAAIFALSVVQWKRDTFRIGMGYITQRKGILFLTDVSLCSYNMSSMEIAASPLTGIFGAVRLNMRTSAGGRRPDLSILLSKRRARDICRYLMPFTKTDDNPIFYPKFKNLLLMALSGENFFSSVFLMIPFVDYLGSTLGVNLSGVILSEVSYTLDSLLPFVPHIFSSVAAFMLLSFLFHVVHRLFQMGKYFSTRGGQYIVISRGVLSRRIISVNCARIAAVDIRQTLLGRLWKLRSAALVLEGHCKLENTLLIPAERGDSMEERLGELFPKPSPNGAELTPAPSGRVFFWLPWAVACLAAAVTWLRLWVLFGEYSDIVGIVFTALILFLLWKTAVSVIASREASVRLGGDCVEICAQKGLTLHKMKIFKGRVSVAKITANPLQKIGDTCTVHLRAKGSKMTLSCGGLDYGRALSVLERIK